MTYNLPQIRFRSQENFCSQTKTGYKVNKYLAVSYLDGGQNGFAIFRMDTGLPAIRAKFTDVEDCKNFAILIAKTYESVFDVWEAWKECELFRISQLSVPNGQHIYSLIEKAEQLEVVQRGVLQFESA